MRMRTIARCLIKLVDQRHHHRCRRRRRCRHECPSQAQHQLTAFTSIDILQASSAVFKPMRSALHVEWREACGAFGGWYVGSILARSHNSLCAFFVQNA